MLMPSIAEDLYRERKLIEKRNATHVQVDGFNAINFCSNDYLNLSQHPKIIAAFIRGIEEFGFGSG